MADDERRQIVPKRRIKFVACTKNTADVGAEKGDIVKRSDAKQRSHRKGADADKDVVRHDKARADLV